MAVWADSGGAPRHQVLPQALQRDRADVAVEVARALAAETLELRRGPWDRAANREGKINLLRWF